MTDVAGHFFHSERGTAWETSTEKPRTWRDDAACKTADPDLFFPERGQDIGPALAYCARCTVRDDCLRFAIDNGERLGIWGGLSGRQLREAMAGVQVTNVCEECQTSFTGRRGLKVCGSLECYRARAARLQRQGKRYRRARA